jgi:hypothetical protein
MIPDIRASVDRVSGGRNMGFGLGARLAMVWSSRKGSLILEETQSACAILGF